MGNAESNSRPYICLLQQLLKKGKHKTSEKRLEELLKVIETHCSLFPNLGTLAIDKWEEVGQSLREVHSNRVSFLGSIWETYQLIHSVLEPLQTDSEEEREKDDIDQFIKTKEGRDDDEGSETAFTVFPKILYPDPEECFEDDCPPPPSRWPPLPPSCLKQARRLSKPAR